MDSSPRDPSGRREFQHLKCCAALRPGACLALPYEGDKTIGWSVSVKSSAGDGEPFEVRSNSTQGCEDAPVRARAGGLQACD